MNSIVSTHSLQWEIEIWLLNPLSVFQAQNKIMFNTRQHKCWHFTKRYFEAQNLKLSKNEVTVEKRVINGLKVSLKYICYNFTFPWEGLGVETWFAVL